MTGAGIARTPRRGDAERQGNAPHRLLSAGSAPLRPEARPVSGVRSGVVTLEYAADMDPTGTQTRTPSDELTAAELCTAVIEGLPAGVVVFDRALRVIRLNRAARLLLPGGDDLVQMLNLDLVAGQYTEWTLELRRMFESGADVRHDGVLYQRPDGIEQMLQIVATPVRHGPANRIVGGVLLVEDVTSRASLERRLAVSERLAATGKLAARVAHELNNPLDGIQRFINLAMRTVSASGGGKAADYLEQARTGLARMAGIISDLLEYSRSHVSQFDDDNINALVEEAVHTMADKADRAGVAIALALRDEAMPRVRGGKLFQVFCNLMKNAIDAMPGGGRLTVTTGVVEREVVIRFEDTGVGLPPDVNKVFEPFYTTKPPGTGTGLGLAICREYVERLHGRITAEPREGGGARFTIRIPLESCLRPSGPAQPP